MPTIILLPMTPGPGAGLLDDAVSSVTTFAGEYAVAAAVIIGIAAGIGLAIWGFIKLLGLFRKSAK